VPKTTRANKDHRSVGAFAVDGCSHMTFSENPTRG